MADKKLHAAKKKTVKKTSKPAVTRARKKSPAAIKKPPVAKSPKRAATQPLRKPKTAVATQPLEPLLPAASVNNVPVAVLPDPVSIPNQQPVPIKSKKKHRWLILLLLLLLGIVTFTSVFLYLPYRSTQQTGKPVESLRLTFGHWAFVVRVGSAGHAASLLEPAGQTFQTKIFFQKKLRLDDFVGLVCLEQVVPVSPAVTSQPTPQAIPTVLPEPPKMVAGIPIRKITASPNSVPEGGVTELSAVVSTSDQQTIARVEWVCPKGTFIATKGVTTQWKAPDRSGIADVTVKIFGKNGSLSTRTIRILVSQNIYVADVQNNRIEKFNGLGGYALQFGKAGTANGQFDLPHAVAIDNQRNIWVADTSNHRIQAFNEKGEYLKSFGTFGTGNGQFNEPYGLAVDNDNNIYVAEYGNRIQKFDKNGHFLLAFGRAGIAPGEFNQPTSLYFDRNAHVLYVSDLGNNRIQKFSSEGKFLFQFGTQGSLPGEFSSPSAVAIDSHGNIYVVDQLNHRVQKFDPRGKYLLWFGGEGSDPGRLFYPMGIVINRGNEIYVTDQCNHRISVYDTAGNFYKSFGLRGNQSGEFKFPVGIGLDF